MYEKSRYVEKKFKQVIYPFIAACIAALLYIIYSIFSMIYCGRECVDYDLFKFCFIVLLFFVPFYGFSKMVKAIVLKGIEKSS